MVRVAVVIALAFLACLGPASAQAPELVESPSKYSVAETLDRLEAAAKAKNFVVFARIDHAAGAAKVGATLRPTAVLLFGSPQAGTPLMQSNQQAGLDLPLKALAYEAADGTVRLAFPSPAALAARYRITDKADVVQRMTAAIAALAAEATR